MIYTLFRLGLASIKRTLQKHLQGVPDLVLLVQGVLDLELLNSFSNLISINAKR